ncbi:MAG: DinB family protein [Cytophagales bacterium]|nr:DinB family protein [Cytophagales bacterium]
MNKSEIQKFLILNYSSLVHRVRELGDGPAMQSVGEKWTPAQQLDHLVRSVRPVALAFSLPKFVLSLIFGTANRPSRSYDGLIEKYHSKLAGGGKASHPFIPGEPGNVTRLGDRMDHLINKLTSRIDHFSEKELDQYILPHPLLGKLTLREMLYFTAYHAQHHERQIESNTKSVIA